MITRELDPQNRGLPTRGIGAYRHGQQVKARFIYKDDGAFFLLGLFLSAGQRSSFQREIKETSSSSIFFLTLMSFTMGNNGTEKHGKEFVHLLSWLCKRIEIRDPIILFSG